ncbi:putative T7SS-secreted protein [Streptomyces marispadix]|uniref:Putative T7SS secretion signal domain-containing protein n=1 Tax=Streptomyces marispadix TaxID=2922868 RepID=A0ABS9T3Z6_9ACTN|nr:hypothetical protein [Streptomyces marispadix]MCH6163246.1 hypothetical protein [Streptomyces marispadix]
MTANSQDWSGLGFNPAPGAAHVVDNLVTSMAKLVRHLNEVYAVLDRIKSGKDDTWTGEAAEAFKKHVGKLPTYLRDARDGAAQARKALDGWHQTLLENQPKARSLEAQAKAARAHLNKAESEHRGARSNPDLDLAGRTFSDHDALESAKRRYKAAGDKLDEAVSKLNSARSELDDLIRRAHALEDDHKSVAHAKERAIREAADSTADPDWNDFKDWWGEHGGDVVGVAAGVLGVAAIFCPVLAPFAVGMSLLALGLHSYQYAKEGALWPPQKNVGNYITLGGDLLGAIPGAKLVGTGLATAARESGGIRAMLSGAEGAGRMSSIQQGVRGGWQGFRDGVLVGKQAIEDGAREAPYLIDRTVKHVAQKNLWSESVETAAKRGATAGATGALTASQVPSLLSDSKQAGDLNTSGGAYANVIGGIGDGVHGTSAGIASALGLGAVALGVAQ